MRLSFANIVILSLILTAILGFSSYVFLPYNSSKATYERLSDDPAYKKWISYLALNKSEVNTLVLSGISTSELIRLNHASFKKLSDQTQILQNKYPEFSDLTNELNKEHDYANPFIKTIGGGACNSRCNQIYENCLRNSRTDTDRLICQTDWIMCMVNCTSKR